jgi:hypothetical protein
MLSATLIRNQVIQVRESREKRLLTATGMVQPFHGKELPLDGVMGLIQQGTAHGHLRVCQHRIPTGLLVLYPAPYPLAVGRPRRVDDVVDKVASSLAKRKHVYALALTRPVQQGVELGAQGLADRGGDGGEFPRELIDRMAEAEAKTRPREERAQTLGGAVETISQNAADAIGRLLGECCVLELGC